MKKQKYSVVAGIILFVLAALFSISLLLVAIDFGGINPAKNSFFYSLGKMFTGVYGLTSAFIPIFLIAAGIQCFISKWRIRNGVLLLGSIIPFFTIDAIEHICRMILTSNTDTVLFVKLSSTLLIGVLVLAGEYLLLSILGEVLENSFTENREYSEKVYDDDDETILFENEQNTIEEQAEQKESPAKNETKIDLSNDKLFLAQKEFLKDLINDGKTDDEKTEEPTIIENPTIVEDNVENKVFTEPELPQEEENPAKEENFTEPKILNEDDKTVSEEEEATEEEISFEEPELSNEEEIDFNEPEITPETDEDSFEDDDISAEETISFDEPEISAEEEINIDEEEEFQNDFDDMEDAIPVSTDNFEEEEATEEEISFEEPELSNEEEIDFNEPEITPETDEDSFEDDDISAEETISFDEPEISAEEEINIDEEEEFQNDFDDMEDAIPVSTDNYDDEEPFGVEDIFSQMEADAAANPVIKDQEQPVIQEQNYQQEIDAPDTVSEEEVQSAEKAQEEARISQIEEKTETPTRKLSEYKIPTDLLEKFENDEYWRIDDETKQAGENLKQTLNEFGIEAEVTGIRKGPVVTMFELLPAPGVKLSKIVNLQDNIALALAAKSVRIVAPIPGKHAVGIEIPNKERAIVSFREIIEQNLPEFKKMAVPVILGKDISGQSQIIDIAKTPHLLIAGATGAGKSVCVNSIILSILYNRSPNEVKLIMVDPKVVELKLYNDIPHLLTPVVTEPKKALQVLQYCICEMERRYALLDGMGVRDIVSYNTRIRERKIATEKLPYIVVIIDEFADLMATSGKELETSVARLTAMSRAVGIHLVLATQRPSVNVITGLIKANIPSRIAFMVASRTDSNIIIDAVGAEKLLGKGDMLYTSAVNPIPTRIQGTLVGDNEVERVVEYVKTFGGPDYIDDEIFVDDDEEGDDEPGLFSDGEDPLYDQALQIVVQAGKASASYIQRRLKIGYNRAARLVEDMEARGIVGPANGSKPREVIHVP